MNARGFSLVELLVVVAMLLVLLALALPNLKAFSVEASLMGAGRVFQSEFRKARSIATRSGAQTAIRFEPGPAGVATYSLYRDGNSNGVLAADIARGVDVRVAGPVRLDANIPGVRVAINPGVPAIPPDRGLLDPADPVRFGRSNMLSFSPLGTATPGTFYLAGEGLQAAVRVSPETARVRLLVCRGGRWVER